MIYRKLSKRHFALNEVPKESHLIGLVVLSPYAAPSLATVDLVWDINHADFDRAGSFTVAAQTNLESYRATLCRLFTELL